MPTLADIFNTSPEKTFHKGDVIIAADSQLTHLYFLTEGVAKLIATSSSGHNLMLHLFHPGSCLPLLGLVTQNVNQYDIVALTDVTLKSAPVEEVLNFIKQNSDVSFDMSQKLLLGLNGLLYRIQQTAFVPALSQVAGVLVYFAKHFAQPQDTGETTISLQVTHQDISEWLGLSRENVSLQMKELEKRDLITKHDRLVVIRDLESLKKMVALT